MIRSIRFRLTLWYILLLALILSAFCVAIYFMMRNSLYENLDDSLETRAEELTPLLADDTSALEDLLPAGSDPELEQFVLILGSSDANLADLAVDPPLPPIEREDVESVLGGETVTASVHYRGETFRVRLSPLVRDGEIVSALAVGRTEDDVSETLNSLLFIMAVAYPATLVLASLGGIFLAGRALGPIDDVTRHARRISADDLRQRLSLDLPDDEVGRLARTFDEMLERLDGAFRRQRQFTADASHELRTPLTAIKGQVEVALNRERDAADYRNVLQAVNEEVDRLIRLVASLLTLARADAGQVPLNRDRVDVSLLVSGAVEQVRPLATERGVELSTANGPEAALDADEGLLLQLLLNLLDNAIKHTPSGGRVSTAWTASDGRVGLFVRDNGAGIAAEDLPRVFDRFYRADRARARTSGLERDTRPPQAERGRAPGTERDSASTAHMSGTGLGLSIARWIAEAHGGSISIESAPGQGTTCTVTLPLANATGSQATS